MLPGLTGAKSPRFPPRHHAMVYRMNSPRGEETSADGHGCARREPLCLLAMICYLIYDTMRWEAISNSGGAMLLKMHSKLFPTLSSRV